MGFAAAFFTHSAFSGDPDWQRDACCAIALWALVALIATDHFYWYKLSKSLRLVVAGL